jgi:hypothetical protein
MDQSHTFAESQLFDVVDEFPSGSAGLKRFGRTGGDGILVAFLPGTPNAWIGVFEFGNLALRSVNGVVALPTLPR